MPKTNVLINSESYEILGGLGNYQIIDDDVGASTLLEGPPGVEKSVTDSAVWWAVFHQGTGQMVYDQRRPYRYKRARNIDNRFPGFSFLCGLRQSDANVTVAPTKMLQWNGYLYIAAGRYLYRLDHSNAAAEVLDVGAANKITDIVDASSGASTLLRIMVCVAVAATEAGVAFYYSATGAASSWTQSNRTAGNGGQPRYGLMIRDTLYLFYRPNEMRSAGVSNAIAIDNGPPLDTAFGAITYIGSATTNIHGVAKYRERLLVKKSDDYFTVDRGGNVVDLNFGVSGQIDTAEAVHTEWMGDGQFYFKWGSQLFVYDGQDILTQMGATPRLQGVGPERQTNVNEDVSCEVRALFSTDRWLWAAVRSSVATPEYWLMCYGQTESGAAPVWHDMNGLGTNACNALGWLALSGTSAPRLYLGYGASVNYIVQPKTDFPPDDPDYRFVSGGEMFLPDHHGRSPSWRKNYYLLTPSALNLSSANGAYIDFHYVLDHSGNPQDTTIGRALNNNPLRFPADIAGRHIELHLSYSSAVNTTTPILLTMTLDYDHEPTVQLKHQFYVVLGAEQATGTSAKKRMADLLNVRQRGGQVAFRDGLLKDTWSAKLVRLGQTQVAQRPDEGSAVTIIPVIMKIYRAQRLAPSYYGTGLYGVSQM